MVYAACRYLNGVRWWGKDIRVNVSTAKHVKLAKEGIEVSQLVV